MLLRRIPWGRIRHFSTLPTQVSLVQKLREYTPIKLATGLKTGDRFLDRYVPLIKQNSALARQLVETGDVHEAYKLMTGLTWLSNKKLPSGRVYRVCSLKSLFSLAFVPGSCKGALEFTNEHRRLLAYGAKSLMNHNPDLYTTMDRTLLKIVKDYKQHPELSQRQVFHFLVQTSLMMGIPRWAAYSYEKLVQVPGIGDDILVLKPIIQHLMVETPRQDMANLELIVRLVHLYNGKSKHQYEFSSAELRNLLELVTCIPPNGTQAFKVRRMVFETVTNQLPYLTVEDSVETWEDVDARSLREQYLDFAYELIEHSIRHSYEAPIYRAWYIIKKTLQGIYEATGDSKVETIASMKHLTVLAKVVTFMSKSKKYINLVPEILKDVPMKGCIECPQLVSALIMYAVRTKNFKLAESIVELLTESRSGTDSRLTHGELNALLSLHLEMNDDAGVQKILKTLYEFGGTSHADLNLVIHKMLYTNKDTTTAWSMLQQLPTPLAKSGNVTYLNYMIDNNQLDFEKVSEMYAQMERNLSPLDSVWTFWTSAYFKYLTAQFGVSVAQDVYLLSLYEYKTTENTYREFNNPFEQRHGKVRIHLPHSVRAIVLKTIAHTCLSQAYTAVNTLEIKEVFLWCLDELRELGWNMVELAVDFRRVLSRFRKIGLELPGDMEELLPPSERGERFDEFWMSRSKDSLSGPGAYQMIGKK